MSRFRNKWFCWGWNPACSLVQQPYGFLLCLEILHFDWLVNWLDNLVLEGGIGGILHVHWFSSQVFLLCWEILYIDWLVNWLGNLVLGGHWKVYWGRGECTCIHIQDKLAEA